jgi:hypothetical protein
MLTYVSDFDFMSKKSLMNFHVNEIIKIMPINIIVDKFKFGAASGKKAKICCFGLDKTPFLIGKNREWQVYIQWPLSNVILTSIKCFLIPFKSLMSKNCELYHIVR